MKYRLDKLLLMRNLVSSREKAKGYIMAGDVLVNREVITKVGAIVDESASIEIRRQAKYVSRGGLKLEKALESFSIDVSGFTLLDVGSSTGGFTDCLLQHGAEFVYSLDVGYNQLDYSLRNHPQVSVMEKVNVREIEQAMFDRGIDMAVIDVSFISLTKVLKPVYETVSHKRILTLVKPQFELGNDIPGFKGVVRQPHHQVLALERVGETAKLLGLTAHDATWSPVKGPKGNIEFLLYWAEGDCDKIISFESLVEEAHHELDQVKTQ